MHNLTKQRSCLIRIHFIEELALVFSQPCGELGILDKVVILVDAFYLQIAQISLPFSDKAAVEVL